MFLEPFNNLLECFGGHGCDWEGKFVEVLVVRHVQILEPQNTIRFWNILSLPSTYSWMSRIAIAKRSSPALCRHPLSGKAPFCVNGKLFILTKTYLTLKQFVRKLRICACTSRIIFSRSSWLRILGHFLYNVCRFVNKIISNCKIVAERINNNLWIW